MSDRTLEHGKLLTKRKLLKQWAGGISARPNKE